MMLAPLLQIGYCTRSAGRFLTHGQLAAISEATFEVGGVFHVLRDIAIFGAEAGWSEFIADLEALSAGMQGNGQPIVGADNINYSAIMLLGCANLDVE